MARTNGVNVPNDIATTLGLDGIKGTLRSLSLAGGKDRTFEISVLPNNSGYLIVDGIPTASFIFRVDQNFHLVSAIIAEGPVKIRVMPISDATRDYAKEIKYWRLLIDNFHGGKT
jgi:hypothetical protein